MTLEFRDNKVYGTIQREWNTTLEDKITKVRIKRDIVLDGMGIQECIDQAVRSLIIRRQKNERACSKDELLKVNGSKLHYTEMGLKIESEEKKFEQTLTAVSGLSNDKIKELQKMLEQQLKNNE